MKLRNSLVGMAMLSLLGAGVIAAADDATTQPSGTEAKPSVHVKLPSPFSHLSDLTDDEKAKMMQIHLAALDQIKQIHQQEQTDLTAVLTDDQKKELDDLIAKQAEEKKAADEAHRAEVEQQKADALKQQADTGGDVAAIGQRQIIFAP